MTENRDVMISESIKYYHPGAIFGILQKDLTTRKDSSAEMKLKTGEVISGLKQSFPDLNILKENIVIKAYTAYYKVFKKTYHLVPQLESVIFNNKKIPAHIPLLQVVFMAELKNMLLTAVHDLDAVHYPVSIGLASGMEKYQLINGSEVITKNGDMFMSDQSGVISSIIYGPDLRTKVTPQTSKALIVVYAPDGIGAERVERHLDDMVSMMRLISDDPKLNQKFILPET